MNKVMELKTHTTTHLERSINNLKECAELLADEPETVAGGGQITILFSESIDRESGLIQSNINIYHTCDSSFKAIGAMHRAINHFMNT